MTVGEYYRYDYRAPEEWLQYYPLTTTNWNINSKKERSGRHR